MTFNKTLIDNMTIEELYQYCDEIEIPSTRFIELKDFADKNFDEGFEKGNNAYNKNSGHIYD